MSFKSDKYSFPLRAAILCLSLAVIASGCTHAPPKDIKASTFQKLSRIKEEKKAEVVDYFHKVQEKAAGAAKDEAMRRFFAGFRRGGATAELNRLAFEMDVHFVTAYGDFYDILFVDNSGLVFQTVRQEEDYGTNLFEGRLAGTRLADQMKQNPGEQFVDYDYYGPSDEPAAFFVTPVTEGTERAGWIVLQAPINRVNAILSNHDGLGRTGEVYLVNGEKLMLTDSRFMADSTILKQKVDTDAVRLAFRMQAGEKVIEDYRGVRVYSAFERFDLFNSSWVIIVEIDEDEVLTDHYEAFKKHYLGGVMAKVMERHGAQKEATPLWQGERRGKIADVSEFVSTRTGELLEAKGVGPCTSVVLYYPGKFGYLSHISPVDDIYRKGMIAELFLGDRKTTYLRKILAQIKRFDLYPFELRSLRVVVVATHLESLETILDDLVGMEIELSQVRVMINPAANYVNVRFDQSANEAGVEWNSGDYPFTRTYESAGSVPDLGTVLKALST